LATLSKTNVRRSDVQKFGYLAMLAFTVFGSFWLEIFLKTSVLKRWKRALISILPISFFFLVWDAYAIAQGHWFFNRDRMLGIYGPFDIPLEEFLFFIIVPMAAILTIEGVTTVKPHLREKEFGKDEEK
jgi:lycopene cyclase domain-containing protein